MLILPADHLVRKALLWFGSIFLTLQLNAPPLVAQDAVVAEVQDAVVAKVADTLENEGAEEGEYIVATDLLPGSVAGLLRIPNLPDLAEGWSKTHLGQLLQDDAMQPYLESQRDQAIGYLNSISSKVGLNTKDLQDISSGEVVVGWLPFANDTRRPFALCIIADIRGRQENAENAAEKIDADLKKAGWERSDIKHRGHELRTYNNKPKPGQLKVEQIAISIDDSRIIAADRDSVVTDLIDAIEGEAATTPISEEDEFKIVMGRSTEAIEQPLESGGGMISGEWFARPFQMGRIIRESLEVDRGNDVDILNLLENQGFDAIKAAGGILAVADDRYDILHRGYILAPPTTDLPSKYELAARMLQFPNSELAEIPSWVHGEIASFSRMNVKIEEAFWASETLINEALGDDIFRDIIDGIRDDKDGPQIDIAKDVLPNLDDQVVVITDNTTPVDVGSERMLVAVKIRDAATIKEAIRKAMEVEPDAKLVGELDGADIWQVERGTGSDDFDEDIFTDLDLGFDEEIVEEAPPLLDHWAIATVEKGPGSDAPYLIFSNSADLITEIATRISEGKTKGLGQEDTIVRVTESMNDLGCVSPSLDRCVRLKLALRAKYELLKQGKLKESGSFLASFYRRFLAGEGDEDVKPMDVSKLPELVEINKYLPDGGSYIETTDNGWALTSFLLK
ncbi:membrane or secreted protein [bacterium]|nr:membrane or secreted protein [Rubripirellula sp.]MDB4331646.1 membrane or secreted protein [bacterium]MDB4338562.1 membrane or secreted protein [Rubripirellula sp.]